MAEMLRDRETRKAVRLQSAHRGRAVRLEVAEWNAMALVIERCTRGHLGRQQARRLRIARDTRRQRSFFYALATKWSAETRNRVSRFALTETASLEIS